MSQPKMTPSEALQKLEELASLHPYMNESAKRERVEALAGVRAAPPGEGRGSMRPVKAWGLICSDKRLVDLAFSTRARAKTSKLNCDKVVRVEIRELPARKRKTK